MAIDRSLLARGLAALGLPEEGRLLDGLARYGEEIELWNPAYGLVGAEADELVVKHLLDSLAPLAAIRSLLDRVAATRGLPGGGGAGASEVRGAATAPAPGGATFGSAWGAAAAGAMAGSGASAGNAGPAAFRLADLGTGAGLPGIPLALAMPDVEVSLVERMGRRVRFLENERAVLGLANVQIQEREVERAEGRFDLLTFRAFRPFERKLFKRVFALCEPDGFVVAYKGRRDKAEAELPEIAGLYSSAEILPVAVPFLTDERCVVVLRPA
jgi:16S rRNA (guanine527-N7)-methyltransferase